MIWAIGDIHGKADLLDKVLERIRKTEKSSLFGLSPVEKIIFTGDYIDRGPDSQEVLDAIMDLEYEKVCLAGNHEDLYLQFRLADPNDTAKQKEFLRVWMDNHGEDTVRSILYGSENRAMFNNFSKYFDTLSRYDSIKVPISSLILPEKYDRFLRELIYSHREVFNINGREVGFCFFHSLPCWDQSLEDQLKIRSNQDFLNYLDMDIPHFRDCMDYDSEFNYLDCKSEFQITKIDLYYSFIWLRTYALRWGYGLDVVVHGHTPTNHYYYSFSKERRNPDFKFLLESYNPDLAWPFLWTRAQGGGYKNPIGRKNLWSSDKAFREIEFLTPRRGAVEAINIDTGAVFDLALTAIGLSDETLSQGLIPVISAFDEKNENYPGLCCERLIKFLNIGCKKDDRKPLVKMMNDFTNQIDDLRKLNTWYNIYDFKIDNYERKDKDK